MFQIAPRPVRTLFVLLALLPSSVAPRAALAQAGVQAAGAPAAGAQAVDEEYTRLIAEHLQDDRISTELVDHLPASDVVPSPLEFHGRIVGTPGELTYAADIHRYLRAIDAASTRATVWTLGMSEEGREMIVMAIADEETIENLERYKGYLQELTDPRVTSEERARQLIEAEAKPIYWLTSGMHSTENGGPEMLQELAFRLAVEETELIQAIRENVITFITPVIEVDGREKQVDTYYFNKQRPEDEEELPLMYWGKYVAHDNNRDAMGQMLALTQAVNRAQLEWAPTIMHDLHEAQNYLYTSTGTGPYNEAFDAITITEWWMLAENDVLQMTKRDVPGVWTYNFYDGWTPNYMFTIAHSHNAIGRFYEVASYGPDNRTLRVGSTTTSREWFRPNPPLDSIAWGPRNNTNIQQSAVLFSLKYVADHRQMFLDNYWTKNKRAVQKGREGPVRAWVIPAEQRRRADAVDALNALMRQGLEVHRANEAFQAGGLQVQEGDYIARADQPFRTLADMYFSLQRFSLENPRPYDDTGWTFQLMRNVRIVPVEDSTILEQDMTLLTAPAMAEGRIEGIGRTLVVDHTTDNNLVTFRFRHPDVAMFAAEEDFGLAGHEFRAGALIIPDADREALEPSINELGLSAWATSSPPDVPTHELDVPRIGYVHAWHRTQDEGWVRGAFDHYGIPYTYFADQDLREGNLREQYDVIVFPHVGGDVESQVNGIPTTGDLPLPYQRTDETPNLGGIDESEDIRGGMGVEGLTALADFVRAGGTLIVEGSTSAILPEYGLTPEVSVVEPEELVAPGSIHRGIIDDPTSPIAYGYLGRELPVFFKNDVVLATEGGGFDFGDGAGQWQNTTPMAERPELSPYRPLSGAGESAGAAGAGAAAAAGAPGGGGAGRGTAGGRAAGAAGAGVEADTSSATELEPGAPRVVLRFPDDDGQMLLSGTLGGGEALAGAPQILDTPLGDGHVVMFAIRPFWRWQTHGTFFLGFNTILNWNDLDTGRTTVAEEDPAPR